MSSSTNMRHCLYTVEPPSQQQQQEDAAAASSLPPLPPARLSLFQKQVNNLLRAFIHTCGDVFPPSVYKANFSSSALNEDGIITSSSSSSSLKKKETQQQQNEKEDQDHPPPSDETILNNKFELAKGLIVNFSFTNEIFITSPMFQRYIVVEEKEKKKENNNNNNNVDDKADDNKDDNEDDDEADDNNNNDDENTYYEEDEEPFSSESEFILCKHAQYLVAWWRRACPVYSLVFREAFPTRHAFLQAVQHAISDFHSILTSYINRRLRATTAALPLPRVIRLGIALKLSPKETEALIFILVHHCSTKLPLCLDKDFTNSMHNIGYYCGMSSRELMFFAGPARLHCKQGVVHIPERLTPAQEALVRMPVVVAAALSGARLSQEETVKLEKTALCDMLIDDGDIPNGLAIERADSSFTRMDGSATGDNSSYSKSKKNNKNSNNNLEDTSLGNMTIVNSSVGDLLVENDDDDDNNDDENEDDDDVAGSSYDQSGNTSALVSPKLSGTRRRRTITLVSGEEVEVEDEECEDDSSDSSDFSGSDDNGDGEDEQGSVSRAESEEKTNKDKKKTNSNNNKKYQQSSNIKKIPTMKKKQQQQPQRQQQQRHRQIIMSSQPSSPTEAFAPSSFDEIMMTNEHEKQNTKTSTTTTAKNNRSSGDGGGGGLPSGLNDHSLDGIEPYPDNRAYMEDAFQALAQLIKARNAEGDMKDEDGYYFNPKNSAEAQLRELKGKERLTRAKLSARLEATRRAAAQAAAAQQKEKGGGKKQQQQQEVFLPKIEELGDKLNLSSFEKLVLLLLIGNVISHDVLIAINGRYVMRDGAMQMTVGYILFVLCETLTQRISGRRCFTKDAPLIKSGLISVNPPEGRSSFTSDLVEFHVDIDRRIVDQMVGLETSPSEMVSGSKLYMPKVKLSDVVLPDDTKQVVMSAIQHYQMFAECTRNCGLREGLASNSSAMVILLSGPSGSGKTLLANALTASLQKKILLVNSASVKSASNPGDTIRFLFREAKLSGSVVFFDECEEVFQSRSQNPALTSILSEFELFDGVVILATTHSWLIDSAMNRRVSTILEFKNPDHRMRQEIWLKHVPSKIPLHSDVDLEKIALDYELSGGLIKNATLAAIRFAVEREKTAMPKFLTMQDLERGAKSQLRGLFAVNAAESALGGGTGHNGNRIITPYKTVSDIVLDEDMSHQMNQLIRKIKSRNILFGQWGWEGDGTNSSAASNSGDNNGGTTGSTVTGSGNSSNTVIEPLTILLKGSEGSGKSLFAEILAHECGINMRIDNLSALILKGKDIVGEMENLFAEARNVGAAVVLDGAEELFGTNDSAEQLSMLLQYHASKFRRPIFLLAKTGSGSNGGDGAGGSGGRRSFHSIDPSHCSVRFSDIFTFQLPNQQLRQKMWKIFIPSRVPLADDIDFTKLSQLSLSAKSIRSICFNACTKAAMMSSSSSSNNKEDKNSKNNNKNETKVTMELLKKAAEEHMKAEEKRRPATSMFL